MAYNYTKEVKYSFNEALAKTKAALGNEGFGVISEIDLKDKFKEKLNIDFRNYKILGACNPKIAHQAIQLEDKIGVLLPCNVLVQEHPGGKVEVTAINPLETMTAVENADLEVIAAEISSSLKSVIDSL